MKNNLILYGVLLTLFCAISCEKHKAAVSEPCKPDYVKDVKPIITTKCALAGCHGAGSTIVDYTIDSNVKKRADLGRIRSYVFELKIMPPASASTLTDQEKETLKCWLDNGAPLH